MPQRPETGPVPPRAATRRAVAWLTCLLATAGACTSGPGEPAATTVAEEDAMETALEVPEEIRVVPDIEERLAWYAPTRIEADLSGLSAGDRRALELLIEATGIMDEIFRRQVWRGNPAMAERLAGYEGEHAEAARIYYRLNQGPWDRLEDMEPFLGGPEHPEGAGYYPADATAEELEAWYEAHPDELDAFRSTVTVVRRDEDGEGFVTVPYSEAYRPQLERAAALLREAAGDTTNESLARFLSLRADAFLSDDYYESDLAWMDLDAPVEVTIGPYETYEDGLFGYKAAFESFLTVALPEESAALARYEAELPALERNLPIPDRYKNFDRGAESPIRVVDEVATGGDARAGVATLAFNLPNDERVREAKGSKKVLLRNVMRAKYDRILVPIAERVLAPAELDRVDFQAYFDFILHHELAHGLGPGTIEVDGRETEVRLELKDLYSTLEEAKADVLGVYDILHLVERGKMDADLARTLPATYVAGLIRSVRFGLGEAHGRGVAAQFNYLHEKGAIEVTGEGLLRPVDERFAPAMRELLAEILLLQAKGDYEGTERFLERYGRASEPLVAAVDRLDDVPRDIRAVFPAAGEGRGA